MGKNQSKNVESDWGLQCWCVQRFFFAIFSQCPSEKGEKIFRASLVPGTGDSLSICIIIKLLIVKGVG